MFKNMEEQTTLGVGSFILVVIGGMNIVYITQMNKYYSLICICIFIVFLKMNYDKKYVVPSR